MINLIFRGLTWKKILAFLDDILVISMNCEDHLKNLAEAFERFRQYGLKLKPRITTRQKTAVKEFCKFLWEPVPNKFVMKPCNSSGVLHHWKALLLIAACLR